MMRLNIIIGVLTASVIVGSGFPAAWAEKEYGEQEKAASGHGQGYEGYGRGYGHGSVGHHGSAGHFIRGLLHFGKEFGLTDEQISKLKAIRLDLDRTRIKAEADIMIAEREAEALIEDEKSDLAAIKAKIEQSESLEAALRVAAIKAKRDAQAVLTPEQREKIKAVHERMKMRGMMGRPSGPAKGETGK